MLLLVPWQSILQDKIVGNHIIDNMRKIDKSDKDMDRYKVGYLIKYSSRAS